MILDYSFYGTVCSLALVTHSSLVSPLFLFLFFTLFSPILCVQQIKPNIYTELEDKAWKVRGEALESIAATVKAVKRIQPSLGDLASALKARLLDK